MRKFEQSKKLVASGLALTFGTFIMSGIDINSSAATKNIAKTEIQSTEHLKSKLEVCSQAYKSLWKPNDQFILGLSYLALLAKQLGVTVQTLETGEFGTAVCTPGFSSNVVNEDKIVEVKNVSGECLVFGYEPKKLPTKPNALYNDLAVTCVITPKPIVITS